MVDFIHTRTLARGLVDERVSNKTGGRIAELPGRSDVPTDARLVLVDAAYFTAA